MIRNNTSNLKDIEAYFISGFVSSGLLAKITGLDKKKIIKIALKGGTALASGYAVSEYLLHRRYLKSLLSVTTGFAVLTILESIFNENINKEQN